MKKFLVTTAIIVSVFCFHASANGGKPINNRVRASFEKEFAGASNINWQVMREDNIYRAGFVLNNEERYAFYSKEGRLIGTGRVISASALPLMVQKALTTKYGNHNITSVVEYLCGYETSYVISVSKKNMESIIQAYASGNIYVMKRIKKK